MHLDGNWVWVIVSLGITAISVTAIVLPSIISYRLKIAQINADTQLKTEEIRARNQLEIERLIYQEHGKIDKSNTPHEAENGYENTLEKRHTRERA